LVNSSSEIHKFKISKDNSESLNDSDLKSKRKILKICGAKKIENQSPSVEFSELKELSDLSLELQRD
jgi:hypothetical protein